jgi:rhodanese-related sulfurtransferase
MANVQEWLATANAVVPRLAPGELKDLLSRPNVVLIDVRDPHEVQQSGKLRGAHNISRGMLEFRADAATPYHDDILQKDRTVVVYCASGGRSALAAKTLLDMGYTSVYNAGGFLGLVALGIEIEPA